MESSHIQESLGSLLVRNLPCVITSVAKAQLSADVSHAVSVYNWTYTT